MIHSKYLALSVITVSMAFFILLLFSFFLSALYMLTFFKWVMLEPVFNISLYNYTIIFTLQ